jgi:23S rRNA pseudouridine1911/1915/1917 synthase
MTVDSRSLPVPDGLDGARVDAGVAKLLGFSRSFAAEVAEAGGVTVDGSPAGKSDRLHAGTWIEVSWSPREAPAVVPALVPGLTIVFDDDDIVVVDSRPASRRTPRSDGRVRPSSAASRAPDSACPPVDRPNAPASSTGSTSGRAA